MTFGQQASAGAGDKIIVTANTAQSEVVDPLDATASYSLESDGDVVMTVTDNSTSDVGDWIRPKINMANYEAMLTNNSGTPPSGTLATWLQLNVNRTWTQPRTTIGTTSSSNTLQIRNRFSLVVLASVTIGFAATVDSP